MSIAESLIEDFTAEVAGTRRILEAAPEDRFDWKPHEKSMSLAQLAGHTADATSWTATMLEDVFELDPATWQPYVPTTRADLLETFDKHAAAFSELLAGKSDDFMGTNWSMVMGGKTLLSHPKHQAIRLHTLHHLIHHRAQLGVYLRLLDVPVPSVYGPTADEPMEF